MCKNLIISDEATPLVDMFLAIPGSSIPAALLLTYVWSSVVVVVVQGDVYLHHPRGSNNRLSEANANTQNQNRMFDSQNNAAAGYQVGDDCPDGPCQTGYQPGDNNPRNNDGYDVTMVGSMEGKLKFLRT